MIEHLQALKASLVPLSYPTHMLWASEVTGQYLVLGSPGWTRPGEMPLCGESDDLDTDIRVTAVTGTPDGVLTMLARVRGLWSPRLAQTRVPMAGRDVRLRFVRSEFVTVDQDVTLANTSRHPGVGVDTYRLVSQPL